MTKLDIIKNGVPSVQGTHISKEDRELTRAKIQEFIQQETKLVRGIFQNFDCPGSSATISVSKYPGVKMFTKSMMDGAEYEIPLYVARFLNGIDVTAGAMGNPNEKNSAIGTCSYVVHGFKTAGAAEDPKHGGIDGMGIPIPIIGPVSRKKRFGFQSMEFAGGAV